MSPEEQRAFAAAKSRDIRGFRKLTKAAVAAGEVDLIDLLQQGHDTDPRLLKMRIEAMLQSVPGIGPRRAFTIAHRTQLRPIDTFGHCAPSKREAVVQQLRKHAAGRATL